MNTEQTTKKAKREIFIARLRKSAAMTGHTEEAEMYISEAEHQDGEGYWDNFATLQDLMTDFELFLEALK